MSQQKMQDHSHTVGDRKQCDETTFQKNCAILLTPCSMVIRQGMHFDIMCYSLPLEMSYHCLLEMYALFTYCLAVIGKDVITDESGYKTLFNITHKLLVIGKDVVRLFCKISKFHSRAVDYEKDIKKSAMSHTCCRL